MLRQLTADEVEFVLECHPEHVPIEGNASAIDPETDACTARWIRRQLDKGNQWAWCCVSVRARWSGLTSEPVYLGCCSYESEESFRQPGGYYDDMRKEALDDLNAQVGEVAEAIQSLSGGRLTTTKETRMTFRDLPINARFNFIMPFGVSGPWVKVSETEYERTDNVVVDTSSGPQVTARAGDRHTCQDVLAEVEPLF